MREPLDLMNLRQRSWILEGPADHRGANQDVSVGNTSPDGGNSPMRTPRPDEIVAEKLDTDGTSRSARRGKTGAARQTLRPREEMTRTTSRISGEGEPQDRDRPWKQGSLPWTPPREPQAPEAQRTPSARPKDPCVTYPGIYLTKGDPRPFPRRQRRRRRPNQRTPGPRRDWEKQRPPMEPLNRDHGRRRPNTAAAPGPPQGPGKPGGHKDP